MLVWEGYEHVFPAAFPVVNAAVYHVLSVWTLQDKRASLPREETAGAVRYMISFPSLSFALYVLQRSDQVTVVKLHPFVPRQNLSVIEQSDVQKYANVLGWCGEEIVRAIRISHPDFSLGVTPLTPPMPSWQDDPDQAIFWKDIYARNMSDQEFARRLGIAVSTLANYRSKRRRSARRKS
jgi:hypothetical protein